MGKRKIPFGYRIVNGEVSTHSQEATCVQTIFRLYRGGASFGDLVDIMKNQGIPYDGNKLWNKNMIARILEDERYTGLDAYPAIIPKEEFRAVVELRETKKNPPVTSKQQIWLRKICDAAVNDDIERQVLYLMYQLIVHPEHLSSLTASPNRDKADPTMHRKLAETLAYQPIQEEIARSLAAKIAETEYAAISNCEYETERMRQTLLRTEQMKTLDISVSSKIIKKVLVSGKGEVRLQLKNDQIIERSALQ